LRSDVNDPVELGDLADFYARLDPHMAAPVIETSLWRTTDASADFEPNASAPIMRTQNIVHLVNVIASCDIGRLRPACNGRAVPHAKKLKAPRHQPKSLQTNS